MNNREYGYEINQLIHLSNERGMCQVEGYALQLDSFLANIEPNEVKNTNIESFINETIEFLYGLLEESD